PPDLLDPLPPRIPVPESTMNWEHQAGLRRLGGIRRRLPRGAFARSRCARAKCALPPPDFPAPLRQPRRARAALPAVAESMPRLRGVAGRLAAGGHAGTRAAC